MDDAEETDDVDDAEETDDVDDAEETDDAAPVSVQCRGSASPVLPLPSCLSPPVSVQCRGGAPVLARR